MQEEIFTPYHALANAVIEQAAEDYRTALLAIRDNPENRSAMSQINDLELFFKSSYYSSLTNVDGYYIVNRIRKEYGLQKT